MCAFVYVCKYGASVWESYRARVLKREKGLVHVCMFESCLFGQSLVCERSVLFVLVGVGIGWYQQRLRECFV